MNEEDEGGISLEVNGQATLNAEITNLMDTEEIDNPIDLQPEAEIPYTNKSPSNHSTNPKPFIITITSTSTRISSQSRATIFITTRC